MEWAAPPKPEAAKPAPVEPMTIEELPRQIEVQPITFLPGGPTPEKPIVVENGRVISTRATKANIDNPGKVRIAVVCSAQRSKQIKIWAHGIIELEIDFYDKGYVEKANRSGDTYKLVLIDRSSISKSTHKSAIDAFGLAMRVEEKLTRNKFVDVVCRLIY
jgi:hypothetical protein